jgi:hypothetical protein
MRCPYCPKNSGRKITNNPDEHLIVTRKGNEFFVHGPVEDKILMVSLLRAACAEADIEVEVEA